MYADDIQIDVLDIDDVDEKYLESFSCGNFEIDEHAQDEIEFSHTKIYLFVDVKTQAVVAYASLACSAIMYRISNQEHKESTDAIFNCKLLSAIEIKYFAVAKEYQHLKYKDQPENSRITLSCNLFRYIVNYAVEIAHKYIGAQYIILYAVPEAESFYKRNMFKRFDDGMLGNSDPYLEDCIPMYMMI